MKNKSSFIDKCLFIGIVIGLLSLTASSLHAQGGNGLRVGLSLDPDQVYLGGHIETGPLMKKLWFRPSLEVGMGSDITIIGINIEFAYWMPLESRMWKAYAGAGPAINVFIVDTGGPAGRKTNLEPGFHLLMARAHRDGFFTEMKLGAMDSPDLKFGLGFSWR